MVPDNENYRHFDNLIWQVPAWSTALFLLTFSGLDVSGDALVELSFLTMIPIRAMVGVCLGFMTATISIMSYVLYRFRLHQVGYGNRGKGPTFGGQFWLQLLITTESMWLLVLFLRVVGTNSCVSFVLPSLILLALTTFREFRVKEGE